MPIGRLVTFGALLVTIHAAAQDERLIFPLQDKHVHSSSIAELPNGDLVAVWFHGSGERRANDVVIQGARLEAGAEAWGDVTTYADTPGLPDCNPVVHVDASGRLWLFWVVVQSNRWEQSILKWRRASEFDAQGRPVWDWQDIILLQPGDDFPEQLDAGFDELGFDQAMWAEYAHPYDELLVDAARDPVKRDRGWMTRTNLVELSNGRWLLPVYSDGFNVSMTAVSGDQGATWTASAPIVGLGNVQPAVVRGDDGALVAYMRDNGAPPKRIMRSESTDNGMTWTPAADTDLPNPGASVAARTLAGGAWVLVYNDTEAGRHSLVAAISRDNGATWDQAATLDKTEPGEGSFGYPAIAQDAEGKVHITYTYSINAGKSIKHVVFPTQRVAAR